MVVVGGGGNAISFQFNSDSSRESGCVLEKEKQNMMGSFLSKAAEVEEGKGEILLSENRSVDNTKMHEYICW